MIYWCSSLVNLEKVFDLGSILLNGRMVLLTGFVNCYAFWIYMFASI